MTTRARPSTWCRLQSPTVALLVVVAATGIARSTAAAADDSSLRGVVLKSDDVSEERLEALRADFDTVAIMLEGGDEPTMRREAEAARRVVEAHLRLAYWIEVARQPQLADAHPEWMASLQGHDQWRRDYPDLRLPTRDEVVKCWPWVPIVYREAFAAQRSRVERLLADKPAPRYVFLNDLQAAPSACGCGHPLCRWTADYGPIRTATPLGPDASAQFVADVRKFTSAEIVPVWATECEEHDKNGLCGGIGCFDGRCWREYTQQLMPVARDSKRLGVLLTYRELQRDLEIYGPTAAWVAKALGSFQTMPPKHRGESIAAERLIAVLQGWDVTAEQVAAQIEQSRKAGAAGYLVARHRIDQSWQPKMVQFKTPPNAANGESNPR